MKIEQIDELLTDLKGKLERVGDNLLDLSQLITYKRLLGEGGWPKVELSGTTHARVAPALGGIRDLWEQYASLRQVIDRASVLRGTVNRLLPSQRILDEVEGLLLRPSIVTTQGVAPCTPGRLLDVMTQDFERARGAILALDSAWDRLFPALSRFDGDAASLQALADTLGEGSPAELSECRRQTAGLRTLVEHDPLAADGLCEAVDCSLKAVRGRLDEAVKSRDELQARLADARALVKTLGEAHRRAAQAYADRELKVLDGDSSRFPKPLEEDRIAALRTWLERLETTVGQGKWKPAGVGLRKWLGIAGEYLAAEEAVRQANEAPLNERRDLRGLLDALKAKAHSSGRSEEAELAAIGQEAWTLLRSRPTPLARARERIAEYEARLL